MNRKRLQFTTLLSLGLFAACQDELNSPVANVEAGGPRIDVVRLYHRALRDPGSLGSRHNAGLSELLIKIRVARAERGGRRLTRKEACELVARETMSHLTREEAQVLRAQPHVLGRLFCDVRTLAREADHRLMGLKDSVRRSANVSVRAMTEDWIDTVFMTDSYWEGPDESPTFSDDEAFLADWASALDDAMSGATSVASAQSAISSLLSSTNISDEAQAEWAAETAALASSSSAYWQENLEAWREEFCDDPSDEGRAARASVPVGCEGGGVESISPSQAAAARLEISWSDIVPVAKADLSGAFGMIGALIDGYELAASSWKRVGRNVPGAAVLVRYTQPTTVQMVVKGAKLVARKALLSGIWGAVASSAISVI